jgi:hypothetical protein
MKKWLYLISVGGLTAIFLTFYLGDRNRAEQKEAVLKEKAKQEQIEKETKRKADEERAKKDADDRKKARDDEEAAKEAEKRRKWDEETKRIQDEINANLARGDKAAKEVAKLEIELDTLHKNGEKLNREAFDIEKRVERAQSARNAAEMEIQRVTEMIAARADKSSMTRMPPPPPVAAAPAR